MIKRNIYKRNYSRSRYLTVPISPTEEDFKFINNAYLCNEFLLRFNIDNTIVCFVTLILKLWNIRSVLVVIIKLFCELFLNWISVKDHYKDIKFGVIMEDRKRILCQ